MDTPELDDQRLDNVITQALYYEITITPGQKQRAWERLRAAATEQIQTSSFGDPCECDEQVESWCAEVEAPEKFSHRIMRGWRGLTSWIMLSARQVEQWFINEDRYRRAHIFRATVEIPGGSLYCYNTQLRFAFSMFQH